MQHLVVAHISQKNNHPDLAVEALLNNDVCPEHIIRMATQNSGLDWLSVAAQSETV